MREIMNNRKYLAEMLDGKSNASDYVVFTADLTIFDECENLQVIDVGMSESMILPMAYAAWKNGKIPIIYTVCSFAINANYDFFTNTVMYSDMDLIIINAGAGFVYDGMGHGHYLLNDVEMFHEFNDFWFIKDKGTIYKSLYNYKGGKCYIRLGLDNTEGVFPDVPTSGTTVITPTMYAKHPIIEHADVFIIENLNECIPSRYISWCYEDTKGFGIGEYHGVHSDRIVHITDPNDIPD